MLLFCLGELKGLIENRNSDLHRDLQATFGTTARLRDISFSYYFHTCVNVGAKMAV